uniref:G-protein coupled receptors family 2 profile 2 domain-containing protein n=1 Tax=Branchiostoma floridae TaxID=7739 RepID=C3YCW1_BRAFL|eukprot:XP_002605902.1 hypothetical protein BRAFLDRAFT_87425 [Branchiostoma floridae]
MVPCIGEEADVGRVASRECGIVEMPEYGYSVAFWRGPDCSTCRVCKPATKSCKGESSYEMDWEETPIEKPCNERLGLRSLSVKRRCVEYPPLREIVEKPCDERLGLRGFSVKRRCVEYPPLREIVEKPCDERLGLRGFSVKRRCVEYSPLREIVEKPCDERLGLRGFSVKRRCVEYPPLREIVEKPCDERLGLRGFSVKRRCVEYSPLREIVEKPCDERLGLRGFSVKRRCVEYPPLREIVEECVSAFANSTIFQVIIMRVASHDGMALLEQYFTMYLNSTVQWMKRNVCPPETTFIEENRKGIFRWPLTLAGFPALADCPYGSILPSARLIRDLILDISLGVFQHQEIPVENYNGTSLTDNFLNALWTSSLDNFVESDLYKEGKEFFESILNKTGEEAKHRRRRWSEEGAERIVIRRPEVRPRHLGHFSTSDHGGNVEVESFNSSETTNQTQDQEPPPRNKVTWENFANVLLHMELLLRRASRKCVQNEDGTVSWTEPMTWMCRSKDSAPFEDLYNILSDSARVEAFISSIEHVTGDLGNIKTPDVELTLNMFETAHKVDKIYTPEVEPQAFPGMTFVSLHNPSNLTNCTDHGGSGNMTLRDHVFQTIPGDLQETVERIDISVLSELIFIPHAVFDDSDVRDTLDVNCSWNHSHNSQAIQFVLYENDRLFPSDINGQNDLRNRTNSHESYGGPGSASLLEEGRQMKIGSRVLASKVQGRCVRNLTEPVVIILKHKMDIADQLGAGPLPVEHRTALNWISWLGCGLSMAGLIGTLVALLFVRSLRQLKTTPCHINLSAAMLLAMVSLQVGVKQTDSRVVCGVQAALIQYFLLVSLAWMAVEALLMYQNLVKVVLTPPRFFFCKSCVTAWVVPAIVVTASVSLRWDSYGADDRCWISDAAVFFATFFVPSMIIVVFNSAIFCLVIRAVLVRKVPGDGFTTRRKDRVREARSAIGLMVLLGLTYLFGSFTVGGARLVFQYIFAVTNSIQGFLIFLFFAVIPVYRQRKSKKKRSDLHNKIPPKSRSKISVVSLDVSSRRLRRSSSQSTVESFTDDSEAVRRKVGALPVVEEESSPETDDDGRTSTDIPDETRAPDEPEGQMFRANTETERHDNQRKPNFTSSPHGYCTRGRMFGQGFLRRTQTSTSESQVDLTLWDDEQN